MGYPMTFRRLVNRSGLGDGDYQDAGSDKIGLNLDAPDSYVCDLMRERLRRYEQGARSLRGDLRRLERDIADEQAICQSIAHRTGIDPEIVAAVLLEFLST